MRPDEAEVMLPRLTTADLVVIGSALGTLLVGVQEMVSVRIPAMDPVQQADQRQRQLGRLQLARELVDLLEGVRPAPARPDLMPMSPELLGIRDRPLDGLAWDRTLHLLRRLRALYPPHALTLAEFDHIVRRVGNQTLVRHYYAYGAGGGFSDLGRGLCLELVVQGPQRDRERQQAGWHRALTTETPAPPREIEEGGWLGTAKLIRYFWDRAGVRP